MIHNTTDHRKTQKEGNEWIGEHQSGGCSSQCMWEREGEIYIKLTDIKLTDRYRQIDIDKEINIVKNRYRYRYIFESPYMCISAYLYISSLSFKELSTSPCEAPEDEDKDIDDEVEEEEENVEEEVGKKEDDAAEASARERPHACRAAACSCNLTW